MGKPKQRKKLTERERLLKAKAVIEELQGEIDRERLENGLRPVSGETWSRIEQLLKKLSLQLKADMVQRTLKGIQKEFEV